MEWSDANGYLHGVNVMEWGSSIDSSNTSIFPNGVPSSDVGKSYHDLYSNYTSYISGLKPVFSSVNNDPTTHLTSEFFIFNNWRYKLTNENNSSHSTSSPVDGYTTTFTENHTHNGSDSQQECDICGYINSMPADLSYAIYNSGDLPAMTLYDNKDNNNMWHSNYVDVTEGPYTFRYCGSGLRVANANDWVQNPSFAKAGSSWAISGDAMDTTFRYAYIGSGKNQATHCPYCRNGAGNHISVTTLNNRPIVAIYIEMTWNIWPTVNLDGSVAGYSPNATSTSTKPVEEYCWDNSFNRKSGSGYQCPEMRLHTNRDTCLGGHDFVPYPKPATGYEPATDGGTWTGLYGTNTDCKIFFDCKNSSYHVDGDPEVFYRFHAFGKNSDRHIKKFRVYFGDPV